MILVICLENKNGNVMMTVNLARESDNILIAGDINCRIDRTNIKTQTLMDTLEDEGFMLVNKSDMPTYVAPNGTSSIDLLLYKEKMVKILE